MNRVRLILVIFCTFLGMVIYTADTGQGGAYWGWVGEVPLGDKLGHTFLMFLFSLLANLALGCRRVSRGPCGLLLGTLLVAAVVMAEECSQLWIPGRSFDLLDLGADLAGIAAGDRLARVLHRRAAAKLSGEASGPLETIAG